LSYRGPPAGRNGQAEQAGEVREPDSSENLEKFDYFRKGSLVQLKSAIIIILVIIYDNRAGVGLP
jgi:hypothetical protein